MNILLVVPIGTRPHTSGEIAIPKATRESSQRMVAMFIRVLLAFTALVLLVCIAPGAPKPSEPKECPVTERDLEAIEVALQEATSCKKSMATFEACSYGSSGDVALGRVVISKCEGDFLNKLSVRQKRAYEQKLKRCWREYRHQSGTMYRSFEAMCAAAVAQTYSRRFLSASGAKWKK
jgi:hypothetical protein